VFGVESITKIRYITVT